MKTPNAKPNLGEPPIDTMTKELLLDLRDELNVLKELFSLREDVGFSTRFLLNARIAQLPQRICEKIYEATDEALADSVDAQIKTTMERTERLITSLYNRLKGGKQE